jgi:hypothetical protein
VQRNGDVEHALVTSGDDLLKLGRFIERYSSDYSASQVISYLLAQA